MTTNFQNPTDLGKRQEYVLEMFEDLVYYDDIECFALGRKTLSFEIDSSEANLLANGWRTVVLPIINLSVPTLVHTIAV